MKIFSKFQDYYDSALGCFLESDVKVMRNTKDEKVLAKSMPKLGDFDARWIIREELPNGNTRISYKVIGMVGFCGKWFYFITENGKTRYVTLEEIQKHNEDNHWYRAQHENYKDPNDDEWWNKTIFEKYGPVIYIPQYDPLKSSTPHWLEGKMQEFVVWPNLKELGFQSAKDPYTALWEIEHWFDTHARPDEAVVPVGDDLTRLNAAGFDAKTSFRKAKETK
jgi:hypothetical protein